jgi:hypothetical protein
VLHGQSPNKGEGVNADDIPSEIKQPKLTRIQLGSDKDIQRAEMDDRLKKAERWVSKALSDEDADMLNRALGIDADILGAMSGRKTDKVKRTKVPEKKMKEDLLEEAIDTKKLRGFLELNPYICSGYLLPHTHVSETYLKFYML